MNKIAEIRKIILQYIASGSVNPNDEKEIEKLDRILRELALRST